MGFAVLLLFCVLGSVQSNFLTDPGENFAVLKKDNFRETLRGWTRSLVLFCSEEDARCKDFAPVWEQIAHQWTRDRQWGMQFGVVNGAEETELMNDHKVRKYPALLLFDDIGRKPIKYRGELSAPEVLRWLDMITGRLGAEIATVEELASLKDSDQTVVVGFFKNMTSSAAKVYKKTVEECLSDLFRLATYATAMFHFPFGLTSNDAIFRAAGAQDGQVVVFTHFHTYEERNVLEHVETTNQTREFVYNNSMPVVIEFPFRIISRIWFTQEVNYSLLLSIDKTTHDYDDIAAIYHECAEKFRDKVRFLLLNIATESPDTYDKYFRLKKSNKTLMRMFHTAREFLEELQDYPSFKPENETNFDLASLSTFVQNVLDGKVQPYVEAQGLPDNWNKNPCKVLVNENFREVVYDKSKSVFVGFYCPGLYDASSAEPLYEELGEIYKGKPDIVIAKFDKLANHLAETRNAKCFDIKLYRKGSKEVVDFSGPTSLENLRAFVDSDGEVCDFWGLGNLTQSSGFYTGGGAADLSDD